jgi:cell division protein FtsQ
MRIVNRENEHFYIDKTGSFMPVSDQYSCPVIVASGFIHDDYAERSITYAVPKADGKPVMVQLYEMAEFLCDNPFWDAQIEQVYINQDSEIELVPRVGQHTILLGSTDDLSDKMNRLHVFYKEGLNKAGWDNYSQINLKFRNQVIGTRSASYKPVAGIKTNIENKKH